LIGLLGSLASIISIIFIIFPVFINDGLNDGLYTGWIFAGYYNFQQETWQQGPYVKILNRVNQYDKSIIPIVGDTIQVLKPLNIIIYNYAYSKRLYELDSPALKIGVLRPADYTGHKLKKGTKIEVRAVVPSHSSGKPDAIWCRIGL